MTSSESTISINRSNNLNFYLIFWLILLALLAYTFRVGLKEMINVWINVDEYGHGFFIPVISGYFIWLRRFELKPISKINEAVYGLILIFIGLLIGFLSGLATVKTLEQYAFIVSLTGLFACVYGLPGLRIAAIPFVFLLFMVPFPNFILNNLSSKLQLISSWIGVEFIRSCNIMVFLEGNVIDLGSYKLQVVDACSGLRYLFPLASLSFLCAFLFRGPFWQKLIIFLSSIPLTIFMNSFRIGVIGVMVQYWGTEMAEGFLHDFEGWIIFMSCMVLLFVEMWLFSKMSGNNTGFSDLVTIPEEWVNKDKNKKISLAIFNSSLFIALGLLCSAAFASYHYEGRKEIVPDRKAFISFPLQIGSWHGQNEYLEKKYLDALQLTDYVIINYTQQVTNSTVNFYTAYFQSQRTGAAIHSPRSCIPGDGWQIVNFSQLELKDILMDNTPVNVDRAIIKKGDSTQLVYYWFHQRGRSLTNEYILKWYLFYDALTMNRTDGSLIRLVTSVAPGEDIKFADNRLQSFLKGLAPILPDYLPGKNIEKLS